jgi:hypothetical protein
MKIVQCLLEVAADRRHRLLLHALVYNVYVIAVAVRVTNAHVLSCSLCYGECGKCRGGKEDGLEKTHVADEDEASILTCLIGDFENRMKV